MADKITLNMKQNKETKNMKRFGVEIGGKDINLYLPNAELEKIGDPDAVKVTVTAV